MNDKSKKRKFRTELRKNRAPRTRPRDLTRQYTRDDRDQDQAALSERITGKGELTRHRTVVGRLTDESRGLPLQPDVDESACLRGVVTRLGGLLSSVHGEDGLSYQCATRRLLKTLSTDQRHVVAVGDRVLFRPAGAREGIIQRIEPRHGILSRSIRNRQQILVTNVDQMVIISSAAEPVLKPHLIDRMIVTAEKAQIDPLICINKIDLVDPAPLQPLIGVYAQLGYRILLLSATDQIGIDLLRRLVANRQNVVLGQSGVGKSSLLNAIQTGLNLKIQPVSAETEKGRHTTSSAQLVPLDIGGYVVDTPGIRQFQLWDVTPEEVAGLFRELRPYVSHCRYPDCSHRHEDHCAVKDAVADGRIDLRRYESYCQMYTGE